jgi:hypothetical protein
LLFGLFGCYLCCSVYCLCVNVYCHRVTTQLQLINILLLYITVHGPLNVKTDVKHEIIPPLHHASSWYSTSICTVRTSLPPARRYIGTNKMIISAPERATKRGNEHKLIKMRLSCIQPQQPLFRKRAPPFPERNEGRA